jgi:hypothetical protein
MMPGPQLFLRYAFMPNHLGFCGGDDNIALLEYGLSGCIDGGLVDLARHFEGAYPYLQLIARANGIRDPLDARVVEAYWIGNNLLDGVQLAAFGTSLEERFKSRVKGRDWSWLAGKAPAGARPHHSFHVLEIFPRIGLMRSGAVDALLENMGQCCVRWGKVEAVVGGDLIVQAQPITLEGGGLALGPPRVETVSRWIDGRGFVDDVAVGEWVAIHWGWACDRLLPRQRANLERYTRQHMALCNATL